MSLQFKLLCQLQDFKYNTQTVILVAMTNNCHRNIAVQCFVILKRLVTIIVITEQVVEVEINIIIIILIYYQPTENIHTNVNLRVKEYQLISHSITIILKASSFIKMGSVCTKPETGSNSCNIFVKESEEWNGRKYHRGRLNSPLTPVFCFTLR